VGVVRLMYVEWKVKVKLKVGKEKQDIEYITWVQHGDNVIRILLLFLC
jgi:hypothetical protein